MASSYDAILKVYPDAELGPQDFAIMMERMTVMKTGIVSGCAFDPDPSSIPGVVGVAAGYVIVKGRLVKVPAGTLDYSPIWQSGDTPAKIYIFVEVNLSNGAATVKSSSTAPVDDSDFNVVNTGVSNCIIATFMNNDVEHYEQEIYRNVGTMQEVTLTAANWNTTNKTYTVTSSLITSTSYQKIAPGLNITEAQLTALQSANIQDGGQSVGSLTLKAFGPVPTVDIPIRVVYLGG